MSQVLPPTISITASAELDREDDARLRIRSVIMNSGAAAVRLIVGDCPLIVRAYPYPERSGLPVWNSLNVPMVCKSIRWYVDIESGGSRTVETTFPVSPAGVTLRDGHYTFTVSVRFLDPELITHEYPAGEIVLRR